MNNPINEKISQFLDNELDHEASLILLKTLKIRPELHEKYNRYQAISQLIKSESPVLATADFVTAVSQQLQNEPLYLVPQATVATKIYKQLAIAASMVAVVVITRYAINHRATEELGLQVADTQHIELINQAAKSIDYPLNKQINDYLQAHRETAFENEQGNYPYARVSSYGHQ